MKKKIIGLLTFILILSLSASMALFSVFGAGENAEDEYQTVVKRLVNEEGATWNPTGNFSAYNQAVENIEDETQQDGGDVIFRNGLSADKTSLETGGWGYAKHSETRDKVAYDINGLTIKYYDNTSGQKFIMFNDTFGQLNSGRFFGLRYSMSNAPQGDNNGHVQLGLFSQSNPSGGYTWDVQEWAWDAYGYGNDYDYFKDPASEGYDGTSAFVGKLNTLEFKLDEGNLCVFLNGTKMFDLTASGVVGNVISECPEGMYISFWGEGSTGTNAMKVTDIYNVVKLWTDGVPNTYTTENADKVQNKISSTGAVQFRNVGDSGYDVTYGTEQFITDLKLNFNFSAREFAAGDGLNITLGEAAVLHFKKTDDTNAVMDITVGGNKLGEQNVPFNFTDTLNTVTVKQLKNFTITVNGTEYSKDITSFTAAMDALESGKLKVGYKVTGSADSVLTPLTYESQEVETFPSVPEYEVIGDNTVIKSDGNYKAVYNTADGEFDVVYKTNKVIADSFKLKFRFGGANEAANTFEVKLGSEKNLIFRFTKGTEKTKLEVLVNNGGEVKVAENDINFDWSYGEKELRFAADKGYSYFATDKNNIELVNIDAEANKEAFDKIKEVIATYTNKMADVTFVMKNGQSIFAFMDLGYYLETSLKAGWAAGAYGSPLFGFDDENSTTLVFNGNSIVKSNDIVVDGFNMKLRTFYDNSGDYASPYVVISSSTNWFSLDTLGAFAFNIERKGIDKANFVVRYALGSNVYGNAQTFTVNGWHWNDNVDNTIMLNRSENGWRWTVNGNVLEPAEGDNDYSKIYEQVWESFYENAGYLQFDSGKGYSWKITEVEEVFHNVPPVTVKIELAESYKKSEEVTLDLNAAFRDANGDTLTFTLTEGEDLASITDGVLKFSSKKAGTFTVTVKAEDGNGGSAQQQFTFVVKGGKSCGSVTALSAAMALLTAAGAAVAVRAKKRG